MRNNILRASATIGVTALVGVATAQTVTEEVAPGVTVTTSNGTTVIGGDAFIDADTNGGSWVFGSCAPDIVRIGPFTGEFRESWETSTQPNYLCPPCFYPCLPDGIFGPNNHAVAERIGGPPNVRARDR